MIVADTSAMLALLDARSVTHVAMVEVFRSLRNDWVLPWAILPELDHMVPTRIGPAVAQAFRVDLARDLYAVEWGGRPDLQRALELHRTYRDLALGLVDGVVMAVAERLEARAIATLDLRDFGAVTLRGEPEIWPRDL
ncbi:MAG: PIN domain-containing protein [Gemmatimonadetes bacterium]|nr:PIN domain-containing protein [Gemmatimonadota bacterium]